MARNALTIRNMGEQACWTIIKQAMGIPDAKMKSDFMEDKVALLLFARESLPERLCATAAVRQMGGTTIYQGADGSHWREEASSFQKHLFPILGYFLDCLYIYGFEAISEEFDQVAAEFPMINAGSPVAHPAHVLADIACMLRVIKNEDIEGVKTAWVGCVNGTLHSLIEAMAWCPFSLTIATPPESDLEPIRRRVQELHTRVAFVRSPQEAVHRARFIYAGRKPSKADAADFAITSELLGYADPEVRLLLSATPVRAIPIAPQIMGSKVPMLVRQSQYRLCVHKRILHWIFEKETL